MKQHRRGLELRSRIERMAARGGDFTEIRSGLDRSLRAALGYDVAALSTLDPATMCWTSCFVSGVDHDAGWETVVYEHEFNGNELNSYASLARAVRPVGRLSALTDGDLSRVERFHDLLEPLSAADEMRAVLRSHGACWGTLTLYRQRPHQPFSDDDERTLAAVTTSMADIFRLTMLRAAAESPRTLEMPPGLLTVDAHGVVLESTAQADQWLALIDDRGRVPSVIRSLAATAHQGNGLGRAALPSRRGSWITLHASGLRRADDRTGRVAIIIEAARPIVLSQLVADAYGLTSREREVTSLITAGLANKEISQRLGISTYTAEDHVKSIFSKTSVPNRGRLVALLQHQHYQTHSDAGHHPSPYGWYLDGSTRIAS